MIGNNKDTSLGVKGNISMAEAKSILFGKLYIKQMGKDLSKMTGQAKIPFKLSGQGFSILPELKYTTVKLAEMAKRKVSRSIKKQIKKKVKKEGKKLQKNIKKEQQKLETNLKNKLKGIRL